MSEANAEVPSRVGRYRLAREIAAGGMATVYLGTLDSPTGFSRVVALKRLHPHIKAQSVHAMLRDEARLSARIRHANVVSTLDVVAEGNELLLVMDFVEGVALSDLLANCSARGVRIPIAVAGRIVVDALAGLAAAHAAVGEDGEALGLIHRDVSPQNILVGVDGVARLADFGIAKARGRLQDTTNGELKGKLAYMAPEQLDGSEVTAAVDLYATGVVLWECLTGSRFANGEPAMIMTQILYGDLTPPSELRGELPSSVDEVVLQAMARAKADRFADAETMALAVERVLPIASPREVAAFLREMAPDALARQRALLTEAEALTRGAAIATDEPSSRELPARHDAGTAARPSGSGAMTDGPHGSRGGRARRVTWAAGALLIVGVGVGFAAARGTGARTVAAERTATTEAATTTSERTSQTASASTSRSALAPETTSRPQTPSTAAAPPLPEERGQPSPPTPSAFDRSAARALKRAPRAQVAPPAPVETSSPSPPVTPTSSTPSALQGIPAWR